MVRVLEHSVLGTWKARMWSVVFSSETAEKLWSGMYGDRKICFMFLKYSGMGSGNVVFRGARHVGLRASGGASSGILVRHLGNVVMWSPWKIMLFPGCCEVWCLTGWPGDRNGM